MYEVERTPVLDSIKDIDRLYVVAALHLCNQRPYLAWANVGNHIDIERDSRNAMRDTGD